MPAEPDILGPEPMGIIDLTQQLRDWVATITDVRIHDSTRERLTDRSARYGLVSY